MTNTGSYKVNSNKNPFNFSNSLRDSIQHLEEALSLKNNKDRVKEVQMSLLLLNRYQRAPYGVSGDHALECEKLSNELKSYIDRPSSINLQNCLRWMKALKKAFDEFYN